MANWDLYTRKLNITGINYKDRQINAIKNSIIEESEDHPSFEDVFVNDSVLTTVVQIIDENAINKNPNKKRMLSLPDETFNIGDLITWNNTNWIVTNIDSDKTIQTIGIIEKCNNVLNLNRTHILYQIPCIVQDTATMNNLTSDENKYIFEPSDKKMVIIPNNAITSLVELGDIFKLGKWNYRTKNIDDISKQGLLVLKLEWVIESTESHTYLLEITNVNDTQINITQPLTINVTYKDNGILVSPTPPLLFTSSDITKATISNLGVVTFLSSGVVTFTVSLPNDNSINDNITVNIIDVDIHNYTVGISGGTTIIVNQTNSYSCVFKDNGVIYNDVSTFYLTGDDGISPTPLATIVSQNSINNTCSIKFNAVGYVKLWVKNSDNSVVSSAMRIQIRNLF